MLEAVLGSPRRRGRSSGWRAFAAGSHVDDEEELMDVGSGRGQGIAPLRVSSSTEDLDIALASTRLLGPGPCFGGNILKMAPSHEEKKTASQRTLKDNCLYFMCIPIWARTGAAFAIGLAFLLLAFYGVRLQDKANNAIIGNYYSLDDTAGGFQLWRESAANPNLGNLSACVSPGGEFREVYLYTINNSDAVRLAMDSDNPTVQPTVHEVGPYYYAVTWNYTDLHWSEDRELLNYTANENLVFCPGGNPTTPWNINGRPSDDESITNVGLGYQMAHYFGDSSGFNADDYIVTKPARDWVMGYEDQKLEQLPHVRNHIVWPLQHNMSVSTQTEWAPTPKNQTLQIWTGASRSLGFAGYMSRVQNIGNAQVCPSFVDTSDLNSPWCTDAWPCPDHMDCPDVETRPELRPIQAEGSQLGYINGSTGQRFPWQPGFSSFSSGPLDCRHSLYLWVPCLLRTVALQCDRTEVPFTVQANSAPDGDETGSEVAVTTRRFRIAPEDAMPSTERPFNAGYNMFGSPWIWNLTAQRQAPIFMSLPHFANSTFEFNTTTKQTDSNVHGLRAPDNYSLPWLGIEIYSGVRLRGAMRFQTNVLVTGKSGNWSEPWMVPIGRVSYEHNASDSTISTIYDQSYGILPRVAARAAQVVSLFFATMLLMLSVQIGVKYYQFERGLMKTKNRKLSRSGAASSYVRRTCLRCGLCGPDRSDIIKRLHEMRQEELLTPLLAGGHSPLRQSVQEEEVALSTPSRKRYAATDDQKIEVHFGQLEQMSSDESDEDDAARNENVHVVTQLDLQTWDDLVAPPGRSQLQKCALIWELMPWIYWWAVGIVPKWMLSAVTLEANSLIVAAILSGFVVASQVVQRLCTAKKDRVFVLVPTVLDISTLLIFSASALIADIGENGGNNWDPWPAIIHGSMLVATVLCVAFGHPFMLPVYCRELRPEIWRERIVFRLSEIVSWVWCIILLLVTALQTVPAFTPQMPSSEKGFMIAWIPIMLLVMIFWFTIWFSMQVEEEFVRALNRLLRKGELMSRRDGTPRVDAFPTPVAAQVETQQQPATDSSTQDGMDLHIVPTLSPMSAPNRGKIEIRRPVDLSETTAAGRECDITTNAPLPELVLDASLQVPEPLVAAHKADRSAALAATQFADASEEVLSASLQPEVVHTVGKAELDKAELDKAELEEKNKEIQQSVAAALAKSSSVSAQLQHATSIDDVGLEARQRERRDSSSSDSSDEFHDAQYDEDAAAAES